MTRVDPPRTDLGELVIVTLPQILTSINSRFDPTYRFTRKIICIDWKVDFSKFVDPRPFKRERGRTGVGRERGYTERGRKRCTGQVEPAKLERESYSRSLTNPKNESWSKGVSFIRFSGSVLDVPKNIGLESPVTHREDDER